MNVVEKISEGIYKEKGSKFISFAIPINSAEDAKAQVERLKKEHPKAVHHCFAYRIGFDKFEDRFSDDGEPNNSAGKPIFGQILAAELTNTLIVVVRYYGGTKLGVGGLVSAYKTAAKDAINNAIIVEKEEQIKAVIAFHPSDTNSLMSALNKLSIDIDNHGFEGLNHTVMIHLNKAEKDNVTTVLEQYDKYEIRFLS